MLNDMEQIATVFRVQWRLDLSLVRQGFSEDWSLDKWRGEECVLGRAVNQMM